MLSGEEKIENKICRTTKIKADLRKLMKKRVLLWCRLQADFLNPPTKKAHPVVVNQIRYSRKIQQTSTCHKATPLQPNPNPNPKPTTKLSLPHSLARNECLCTLEKKKKKSV